MTQPSAHTVCVRRPACGWPTSLLRKAKGRLMLTVAAKRMLEDPLALWHHLAAALTLGHRHPSEQDAAILMAVEVAGARRSALAEYLDPVGYGLMALDWESGDGGPLNRNDVHEAMRPTYHVLGDLGVFERTRDTLGAVTDAGQAFARAILGVA